MNAAINILFKTISGESLDYRRGDFINGFDYVKNIDNFVDVINHPVIANKDTLEPIYDEKEAIEYLKNLYKEN